MAPYILRRLLASAVTLMGIAAVTFALMHAVPGAPFEALAGDAASASLIAAQDAAYGLDEPLPEQFLRTLGNLARGDLGLSFAIETMLFAGVYRVLPETLPRLLRVKSGRSTRAEVCPLRSWRGRVYYSMERRIISRLMPSRSASR